MGVREREGREDRTLEARKLGVAATTSGMTVGAGGGSFLAGPSIDERLLLAVDVTAAGVWKDVESTE